MADLLSRIIVPGLWVLLFLVMGWLGFQIKPRPFPAQSRRHYLGTIDLPPDLPEPVRRYYLTAFGAHIPRVETLVVWARARIRRGLWLPLRSWVAHVPGYDFRRYMEVTWFGLPVMKVIDEYIHCRGMTKVGKQEATGEYINQAANLILWAEAAAMPSLLISDPRVRWEAIDANSARLIVPFENQEDALTARFDSQTGLISRMEAMRHKNGPEKVLWLVDFLDWGHFHDALLPTQISITWADDGTAWSYWDWEAFEWNVDIADYIPEVQSPLSAERPLPMIPVSDVQKG
jgi:hypothetical protein